MNDNIAKQLARQFGGSALADLKKAMAPPPPPPAPPEIKLRDPLDLRSGSYRPKGLLPSERMMLGTGKAESSQRPKRPPVLIAEYTLDDLEWMFSTPVKRGWVLEDWLEVIGLPRNLHPIHDEAMYRSAAREFLRRKGEAHHK